MNKCPFCGSDNVGLMNLPEGQHILLQTVNDNGNINIGNGYKVDLIACGSCKNMWLHSDGITAGKPEA